MKTIDEMIEVMQAFSEGKKIEMGDGSVDHWIPVEHPMWNWGSMDYRISSKQSTKPYINWEHVSDEYNWLARDLNGNAYLYSTKPQQRHNKGWYPDDGYTANADFFSSYVAGDCDWKYSLVERPKSE